mgnify:CR=1 FL=1
MIGDDDVSNGAKGQVGIFSGDFSDLRPVLDLLGY